MNSQDFANQFSNDDVRAHVLEELHAFCTSHNLNYMHTGDKFKITLPEAKETKLPSHDASLRTRKKFNTDDWGPRGLDETGLPDELDLPGYTLNEGESPEGYDEDEQK